MVHLEAQQNAPVDPDTRGSFGRARSVTGGAKGAHNIGTYTRDSVSGACADRSASMYVCCCCGFASAHTRTRTPCPRPLHPNMRTSSKARDALQLRAGGGGGGGLQACFSPVPSLGSWGWAHQSNTTGTFKESYLKCTVPPPAPSPLGKGTAPTDSNHLPPSGGRGLPLFDVPQPEMFLEASKWVREAFGLMLLLGPQAGHTCTSWYAHAAMFGIDIHDRPILPAFSVTCVLALSLFCRHKVFASYITERCSSFSRSSHAFCLWLMTDKSIKCPVMSY